VLVWTLAAVCAVPVFADAFSDAKRQYRDYLKRPSLFMRTRGRKILARTKDARALDVLAKSYGKAEAPKDQVRYLIASITANHFQQAQHVPRFDQWRAKHDKDRDAWLWHRALVNRLATEGRSALEEIALGEASAFLRAAAIEALILNSDEGLLALVPRVLAALPEDGVPRGVLIESLAQALFAKRELLGEKAFGVAAEGVIKQLDEERTLPRTRLVVVRRLARIFNTDILGHAAAPWLLELKRGTRQDNTDDRYGGGPTFIGIEATGDRIVYVIDLSDSMLLPLSGKEREELKRGPITGDGDPSRRKKRDEIDWDKVHNRFEAAREFLKLSLRGLEEKQRFAVIFFGTEAARMKSSPGLSPATEKHVAKVIRELDAIAAGPPKPRRPHGTLEGLTNIHGGMHRAFKLNGKSMVKSDEYVAPVTFEEGCNTIFLLSDGAPTTDDWMERDKRDPQDRGGDPEMGGGGIEVPFLNYYGPYALVPHLVDDIRRLNLFRKVEIHCIGMGEARMPLLRRIAALGLGKARKIGEPEPVEAPPKKNPGEEPDK
jgi:hypothetical protein